ncbi:Ig-like domain-containing protein [bacterium]|nr:Ig-like domain-containing protein [candidate division CSSED10-310 bacterium]
MRPRNQAPLTLLAGVVVITITLTLGFWSCDSPDPTGPAASARITITVTDSAIPADGVSTSLITAYVYNQVGQPAEGPIYWTTTCGSLDKSSETMDAGVSSVTLTAPNSPCTAVVTADAVHARKSIEINCYAIDAYEMDVSANPSDIPADGYSTSTISAVVTDARGESVPDGTAVDFSTSGGTLSAGSATTEAGRASVTLTSETVPKSAKVSATSGSATDYTWVRFYSTSVGRIDLRANPSSNIPADGTSSSIITATVYDITGNPAEDGTTVYFTSTWGRLSATSATTYQGVATVILVSSYDPNNDQTAIVTAVSGDVSDTVSVHFRRYFGTPNSPIPTSTPTAAPTNTFSPTPTASPSITPTPASPTAMKPVPDWFLTAR